MHVATGGEYYNLAVSRPVRSVHGLIVANWMEMDGRDSPAQDHSKKVICTSVKLGDLATLRPGISVSANAGMCIFILLSG